jgi:transcriptional regulator with XRE-family HTH domain
VLYLVNFKGENMHSSFKENIRIIRKARGMSIRGAARRMKISTSTLQRYENGETEPKITQLNRIADALDIDLDTLCGRKKISIVRSVSG